MPFVLTSVSSLQWRAESVLSAFHSLVLHRGELLRSRASVTQILARGIGDNFASCAAQLSQISNDPDFASVTPEVKADVNAVLAELTGTTLPTIQAATDPDAIWSGLSPTAKTNATKSRGLGKPNKDTPDKAWQALANEEKHDAIQHAPIAKTHHDALKQSIAITYAKGQGKKP